MVHCRVISNAALLDLPCLQRLLGSADLRVEIFHVILFLLMFASCRWTVSQDQVQSCKSTTFCGYNALRQTRHSVPHVFDQDTLSVYIFIYI